MDLARLSDEVEVISRGYARAHGITRDETWFLLKLQEEVGELTQAFLMRTGQARSKGLTRRELDDMFGAELADVLCHVLLMARHHGIDLAEQVERKWLVWRPDRSGTPTCAPDSAAGSQDGNDLGDDLVALGRGEPAEVLAEHVDR